MCLLCETATNEVFLESMGVGANSSSGLRMFWQLIPWKPYHSKFVRKFGAKRKTVEVEDGVIVGMGKYLFELNDGKDYR